MKKHNCQIVVILIICVLEMKKSVVASELKNKSLIDSNISHFDNETDNAVKILLNHDELFSGTRRFIFREIRLQENKTLVNLENFEDYVEGFGVVHLHGFGDQDFSLIFNKQPSTENSESNLGKHLGFVMITKDVEFWIYCEKYHDVSLLFAFIYYDNDAPVPGGCNQELINEVSPILFVHRDTSPKLIEVDTPAAAIDRNKLNLSEYCWIFNITYEMRYRYVKPRSIRSNFRLMKRTILGKDTYKWNKATVYPPQRPSLRRLYKDALNLDLIVVTIISSKFSNTTVSYIPILISSSLDHPNSQNLYILPISMTFIILGVVKLFLQSSPGTLISPFFSGIEIGLFVVWISTLIISAAADQSQQKIAPLFGLGIGLIFGVIWCLSLSLIHRCTFIISVTYKIITAYIITCYVLHFMGDQDFLINQIVYWEIFLIIMLLIIFVLIICSNHSYLITTVLLGTLYIFISLNYLAQSGLRNAIYYNYERIVIPLWNYAYGNMGMTIQDFFTIAFAMMILVSTLIWRLYQSENWAIIGEEGQRDSDERQPLISRWTDASEGSDSVFESPRTNYQIFRQISKHKRSWLFRSRRNSIRNSDRLS